MQKVNSLCTDSRTLRNEYYIVRILHNTAIWLTFYYFTPRKMARLNNVKLKY